MKQCWLLVPLLLASAVTAAEIRYDLPRAARVSVIITDPAGQVVRELLHAAPRPAGTNTDTWDGRDDQAKPVPAGNYQWKFLSTQGLRAEYLLTLGTNPTPPWETWPGNHGGASAVAVDAGEMYVGGGCGEGTPLLVKQSVDGARRLWTIPTWLDPWVGISCIAVDRGTAYLLQFNAKLYRFDAASGKQLGDAWPISTNQCAGRLSARAGQIVMSTPRGVAWLDHDTGRVLEEAALPSVYDLKIDRAGRVVAISQDQVVALVRGQPGTQVLVAADNLHSPFRLALDPATDDIWVSENPDRVADNDLPPVTVKTGNQVKRFSAKGKLLRAYGKHGGRPREGRYNPTAGFLGVCDLVVDGRGGFIVVEPVCAPRRVAHFNKRGKLMREWYGGQQYANFAAADPADPSLVWLDSHWGELIQAKVDYRQRSWKVHATYRFVSLVDGGLIRNTFHGGGRWHVRHHAGQTFLLREGTPCVVRVDEKHRRLVPLVASHLNVIRYWDEMPDVLKTLTGTTDRTKTDKNSYLWMDQNGDGLPQFDEMNFSTYSDWHFGWAPADGFDYYATDGKKAYRLPMTGWSKDGVPQYAAWERIETVAQLPPLTLSGGGGAAVFWRDRDGSLYAALNTEPDKPFGVGEWARRVGGQRVVKWDAHHKLQWAVGRHAAKENMPPGEARFFWRPIGTAHGCLAVGDSENSLVHVWDTDGLWVGRLLENPDLKVAPASAYDLCGENFGGSLYENPKTGEVLFFGGGVNSTPVYRITGWDQFQRQQGEIRISTP